MTRYEHTTSSRSARTHKRGCMLGALALLWLTSSSSFAGLPQDLIDAVNAPSVPIENPAFQRLANSINARSAAVVAQKRQSVDAARVDPMIEALLADPNSVNGQLKKSTARVPVRVYAHNAASLAKVVSQNGIGEVKLVSTLTDSATIHVNAAELARLRVMPEVLAIRALMNEFAGTFRGSKVSEGDRLHRAINARQRFGVEGKGVSVCVISDGVTNLAASQASGDLPPSVEVCPQGGFGDEGTAMLEIVHDLAPKAKLAFCGGLGNNTFIDAVLWSATQANNGKGCDVIVDDLFNLAEPRFEISLETQLINDVVEQLGKTFVTSAGNLATDVYRSYFIDSGLQPGQSARRGFHDFGRAAGRASNSTLRAAIAPGERLLLVLQWSEAFGKAKNDFVMDALTADGRLIDQTSGDFEILLRTDLVQDGNGLPIEALSIRNKSTEIKLVNIVVKRKTGSGLIEFSVARLPVDASVLDPALVTPFSSILAHSGAERAISVAAVDQAEPGLDEIQPFSSRGIVRTTFNFEGEFSPLFVLKPDITGVDGVAITGAGGFGAGEPGAKRFFGTSASAPHIAGIAALIKSKNRHADVKQILQFSAQRRPNYQIWGAGIADAENALRLTSWYVGGFKSGRTADKAGVNQQFVETFKQMNRSRMAQE